MQLHHRRLVAFLGLDDHVPPPAEHGDDDEEEAGENVPELRVASLLGDEVEDSADGEQEAADGADDRPRAWIDEVIVVLFYMRVRVGHVRLPLHPLSAASASILTFYDPDFSLSPAPARVAGGVEGVGQRDLGN